MASPAPSTPHPWLLYVTTVTLSIGASFATTSFTAGERTAELRQVQATQADHGRRIEAVEGRANKSDVDMGKIVTELSFIRSDIRDVKDLLKGKPVRYVRE